MAASDAVSPQPTDTPTRDRLGSVAGAWEGDNLGPAESGDSETCANCPAVWPPTGVTGVTGLPSFLRGHICKATTWPVLLKPGAEGWGAGGGTLRVHNPARDRVPTGYDPLHRAEKTRDLIMCL